MEIDLAKVVFGNDVQAGNSIDRYLHNYMRRDFFFLSMFAIIIDWMTQYQFPIYLVKTAPFSLSLKTKMEDWIKYDFPSENYDNLIQTFGLFSISSLIDNVFLRRIYYASKCWNFTLSETIFMWSFDFSLLYYHIYSAQSLPHFPSIWAFISMKFLCLGTKLKTACCKQKISKINCDQVFWEVVRFVIFVTSGLLMC